MEHCHGERFLYSKRGREAAIQPVVADGREVTGFAIITQ